MSKYIKEAQRLLPEIEKTFVAVKECIGESNQFPYYMIDLFSQVQQLMYLNIAHNAIINKDDK
jgi:hypothetical protein